MTKTPRRWPKFGLRSFLIFIGVMAIPLGWCSWKLQQSRKERWAAGELENFSGIIYQVDECVPEQLPAPLPATLRMVFGDDLFLHVTAVHVLSEGFGKPGGKQKINNDTLAYLRHFPRLGRLFVLNSDITDAGLKHFKELKALEFLDVAGTQISESGMADLRRALPKCMIVRGPWKFEAGRIWDEAGKHGFGRTH